MKNNSFIKTFKILIGLSFIIYLFIAMSACEQSNNIQQININQMNQQDLVFPKNLKINYIYEGEKAKFGVPGSAKAYDGALLIAEAEVIDLIKNPYGGGKLIKVRERQFLSGSTIYEGFAYFEFTGSVSGMAEPRFMLDEKINGQKHYMIFSVGWPEGFTPSF
jgi:hypothetical protein